MTTHPLLTPLNIGNQTITNRLIVAPMGNVSDWTAWVRGTTEARADKVLDILSGQISQSHLDQSLRTPIAKIGGIETDLNGVKTQIPSLQSTISTILGNCQR